MAAKEISPEQIVELNNKSAWLPTLFIKRVGEGVQGWRVGTFGTTVVTSYGLNGGKQQWNTEEIKEGKNLGKKNATTAEEQAVVKAQQMYDKKVKEGYQTDYGRAAKGIVDLEGIDPMLAHPIADKEKHVKFPALCQPKLDGHRCIAVIQGGSVKLFSRTRKQIHSMPHIVEQLEKVFVGKTVVLDGELYNHDLKADFERLTSLIKRDEIHEDHKLLQYHTYDVADGSGHGWTERTKDAHALITKIKPENIRVVDTYTISDHKELIKMHDYFVSKGYEGAMHRNPDMPYENQRSAGLLKVKVFKEKEFEVFDFVEGKGKFSGGIGAFRVRDEKNNEFNVAMNGTIKSLEEYKENFDSYRGRMLTVQYQKESVYGIPIFGRGLRFREDL